MNLKPGVRLHGIRPELVVAMHVASIVYAKHGLDLWITSVADSQHEVASLHYVGAAFDCRTTVDPAISAALAEQLRYEIAGSLGPDFDVVLETNPDHIHIEFQPKTP